MAESFRSLFVAVGTAVVLWLIAAAIGVSAAVLQRTVIVFGFAGVVVAWAVEAMLRRRRRGKPATPASTGSVKL